MESWLESAALGFCTVRRRAGVKSKRATKDGNGAPASTRVKAGREDVMGRESEKKED